MNYLIIVPARGGSKGIPKKNIVPLNNLPLIRYTTDVAVSVVKTRADITAIVSTDDVAIKDIALSSGITVPFLRPSSLSDDTSASTDYVKHALEFYWRRGIEVKNVIILQPTSPLRVMQDVLTSIELFEKENKLSLISVYEEHTINSKIIYTQNGNIGIPASLKHSAGMRRQDDAPLLVRNGAIYITNVKFFQESSKIVSNEPLVYVMPKYRSINIDTLEDLIVAEKMLD